VAEYPTSKLSITTKLKKGELINIINSALIEMSKMHSLYLEYFAEGGDKPALAEQIGTQLKQIRNKYVALFEPDAAGIVLADKLDKQISEIEDYHVKLLSGDDSIKADIDDSQDRITKFYIELFQTFATDKDGGRKAKIEEAFKSITDFDETLNKAEVGYKDKIEAARAEILAAYKDIFTKDNKSNKSKIEIFNEHITEANDFHEVLRDDVKPYIDGRRKEIDDIEADIKVKQAEVNTLLSRTTISALSQAYLDAMQIYGDPMYSKVQGKFFGKSTIVTSNLFKLLKHFFKFLGSYLLFIGPLLVIGIVFATNWAQHIFILNQAGTVHFSGSEYIFYKLTIALPLLWVSWYGQKSISHRKRLFEEYNHKLRVVQMYLQFITKNNTYTLREDSRKDLEQTLLDSVARNPSMVYGDDETLLDKLINMFVTRAKVKNPELVQEEE
jgi:hypothetical protein